MHRGARFGHYRSELLGLRLVLLLMQLQYFCRSVLLALDAARNSTSFAETYCEFACRVKAQSHASIARVMESCARWNN